MAPPRAVLRKLPLAPSRRPLPPEPPLTPYNAITIFVIFVIALVAVLVAVVSAKHIDLLVFLGSCSDAHHIALAQARHWIPFGHHRILERDTHIAYCSSAVEGDYLPCMRNNLNHSRYEGPVTYELMDSMRFFWERRPRLLEPSPRSSIFNLRTSAKHSFDVTSLSPTQREGLYMWSKCTYPPFGQTLTRPLNLSCPFQAFNLLFLYNTLGDGRMYLPAGSIDPAAPPLKYTDKKTLSGSIPRDDPIYRFFHHPRILHVGSTPLSMMMPLEIENTPHNLATILSQLLHEMVHVAQYIYSCPICYSHHCADLDPYDLNRLRYGRLWLPLTVAIDLMLTKEGVLEIPGVNWKEHRLDLHTDRVALLGTP